MKTEKEVRHELRILYEEFLREKDHHKLIMIRRDIQILKWVLEEEQ